MQRFCLFNSSYVSILAERRFMDLLQHGRVSDGPALEGRPGVTLDLYELVLLGLGCLNVGRLHKEGGVWI